MGEERRVYLDLELQQLIQNLAFTKPVCSLCNVKNAYELISRKNTEERWLGKFKKFSVGF